ncbi:histidine triad (HIT) family protein [Mycoplasmopsis mustelae]|uniref:Histidine triad (HIT) family protein n=1 Tax=Mycoplasmopsis mustelae TaxID=171289 RepID=A0A4R7UDT5_9BACT|nr:HIT family protein [Mycoplasmopsis mustelae]TDV24226.1 histidine triad (HIT) family protein [Mycoplasmopsis mustelae]
MDSLFSKIINRQLPANILYEDERVIAIYDIKPVQPGHFLVIPKNPAENILLNDESDFLYAMSVARKLAQSEIQKYNKQGFKLLVNTGATAGQVVMHTHIHIIPY